MSRIGFHHSQAVPEAVVTGAFHVYVLHVAAVALGLIFKTEITDFVNKTFEGLDGFN